MTGTNKGTKPLPFDNFEQKKPASEMTRFEVFIDFIVFLLVSAGYVVQVSIESKAHFKNAVPKR